MSAQTWPEFLASRQREIRSLARSMVRRWKLPTAVEEGDLEQEMLLGAWQGWHAFEPGRGDMRRDLFALYRARQQVQRWINDQRNAARRNSKAPGRYPEAVEWDDLATLAPSVPAGQEQGAAFTRAVREVLESTRQPEAMARVMSAGFDVDVLVCPVQRANARREVRRILEVVA